MALSTKWLLCKCCSDDGWERAREKAGCVKWAQLPLGVASPEGLAGRLKTPMVTPQLLCPVGL